jgi:Holliday junction DNA helicase RuvA
MIGSLRGQVIERSAAASQAVEVLIEVGGVGYLVTVTPSNAAALPVGSEAFVHVHHHVRDDVETLYGFSSRDERTVFGQLIATHGVGPSIAIAILATHSPRALQQIVASADLAALTMVPGIGKKTAERLVIELKSRLDLDIGDVPSDLIIDGGALTDVRSALTNLGYGSEEIRAALADLDTAGDAATLLRQALATLGAGRA